MKQRTVVFIDYQNVYHRARAAFGQHDANGKCTEPPSFGHVNPLRLGMLLKQLGEDGGHSRTLTQVRIYRGEPATKKAHPTLQAAFQRQIESWKREPMLKVNTRPLRYLPTAWDPTGRPTRWGSGEEKGIDVLIALDMVVGAIDDTFDVAVLVSGDTDLLPAVERVIGVGKRVENAVWWPDHQPGHPLRPKGRSIWCHRLTSDRFHYLRDDTDYAQVGARSETL